MCICLCDTCVCVLPRLCSALNTIILAVSAQQRRPEYEEVLGRGAGAGGAEFFPGCSVRRWCQEWGELLAVAVAGKAGAGAALEVNVDLQGLVVTFVKQGEGEVGGDFALVTPCEDASASPEEQQARAQELEQQRRGPTRAAQELGSNELDILALGFTAVKLLFLRGQLGALPPLVRHLEGARRASKKPLHETK